MAKSKIVNIYIEDGTLLRIVSDKNNADIIIEIAKKKDGYSLEEEKLIKLYLIDSGISTKAGGFKYLIMAIGIVSEKLENKKQYSLAKDVYPLVAQKYSVTAGSVDRAICNAIERSLVKGVGPKCFIEKYKLGV